MNTVADLEFSFEGCEFNVNMLAIQRKFISLRVCLVFFISAVIVYLEKEVVFLKPNFCIHKKLIVFFKSNSSGVHNYKQGWNKSHSRLKISENPLPLEKISYIFTFGPSKNFLITLWALQGKFSFLNYTMEIYLPTRLCNEPLLSFSRQVCLILIS